MAKKKPNVYTCPHCSQEFEKSARNSKNQLCCPHCGGLIQYKSGFNDKGKRVGWYIKRQTPGVEQKHADILRKCLSLPTDIPQVFRILDGDTDYEVEFQGVFANELRCPACGKVTTKNNYVEGRFDFMCKAPIDPKRNNGRKGKCNTRIRYIFKR